MTFSSKNTDALFVRWIRRTGWLFEALDVMLGWAIFFHINFQGKGHWTFSPTRLMQCVYFGYEEQDDHSKCWMWCWVKPCFSHINLQGEEKGAFCFRHYYSDAMCRHLGAFGVKNERDLMEGKCSGQPVWSDRQQYKHQLWSKQWTNLERAQPHAIEGPASSLTHMYYSLETQPVVTKETNCCKSTMLLITR